jgi:hypothetical protein
MNASMIVSAARVKAWERSKDVDEAKNGVLLAYPKAFATQWSNSVTDGGWWYISDGAGHSLCTEGRFYSEDDAWLDAFKQLSASESIAIGDGEPQPVPTAFGFSGRSSCRCGFASDSRGESGYQELIAHMCAKHPEWLVPSFVVAGYGGMGALSPLEVKRWSWTEDGGGWFMKITPNGEWVNFRDYAQSSALVAELAQAIVTGAKDANNWRARALIAEGRPEECLPDSFDYESDWKKSGRHIWAQRVKVHREQEQISVELTAQRDAALESLKHMQEQVAKLRDQVTREDGVKAIDELAKDDIHMADDSVEVSRLRDHIEEARWIIYAAEFTFEKEKWGNRSAKFLEDTTDIFPKERV